MMANSNPAALFVSALRNSLRWLILVISLVAFTLIYADNTAFNFSVICIIRPPASDNSSSLFIESDPKERFYYDYTAQQRNYLFSAAALGGIIGSFVITPLIDRWGTRMIFTLFGLGTALTCLLMPLSVRIGFWPMFLLRLLQGGAIPAQYVACGHLTREWSPLRSSGLYLLTLSTQFQLAPMFTMPISGVLCESSLGWPAIYYFQGILTLAAFALFYFVYRENPTAHPWITAKEEATILRDKLVIIHSNNGGEKKKKALPVPYKRILSDPVVWIVMASFLADDLGFQIFVQYGPIYLNRVLGMNVRETGFLAALPFLLSIFSKMLMGPTYDRLPWKDERIRIYIFAAINQLGMIGAFLSLTFLPLVPGCPFWLIQLAYTSITVFSGLDFLGVIKCSQRISQQFSSTIMAWESIISNATILLLPVIVGLVAPNNSVQEWALILVSIALVQAVTMVLFFLCCDTKPRPWTFQQKTSNETTTSEVVLVNNVLPTTAAKF